MNVVSAINVAILLLMTISYEYTHAFTQEINRRTIINTLLSISSTIPTISNAIPANQPGVQGMGGSIARVEGIGGGFDIRTSTTSKGNDVIYPASMVGLWNCRRVVTSIEGDSGQAELAWKNLGGNGSIKNIEAFTTRFLLPGEELNIQNAYTFDGELFAGVVLDRGYEIEARKQGKAQWDVRSPNFLVYENDGSNVEVAVVQRKIEMPSEKGFGFNELYRITSSAGGVFGESKVQRAVRVQRRYRRATDDNGNRVVEGLEIMKTYRVLDGIAGVEMPTSTTKSQIKLRRE